MKYGDVTVRIVDTAKYTDFIIRTFEISKVTLQTEMHVFFCIVL